MKPSLFASLGFPALVITVLLFSCGISRKIERSDILRNNHTGFALYDLEKQEFVDQLNADRYFTPASNIKIFTLWAGLKILGDSIPALRFATKGDSLIISGTGDPSFLNPVFRANPAYDFLSHWKGELFVGTGTYQEERFGPGWGWDDYPYPYSVEKAAFPIYGNVVRISQSPGSVGIRISPGYFEDLVTFLPADSLSDPISRSEFSNRFQYRHQPSDEEIRMEIPFIYSDSLLIDLLSNSLQHHVQPVHLPADLEYKILYSQPLDTLYKIMMQQSDNFLAEQVLLLCSFALSDTLSSNITIKYMMENWLKDLPDPPVWVDGSGLSRYNLTTPRSIVRLWEKIYTNIPRTRLFRLLAQGGKAGTLRDGYRSERPYVFGKTGTLRNNHCLSGFLTTRKGKTYIFSFMNNNYTRRTSEIKQEMESILVEIHDRR